MAIYKITTPEGFDDNSYFKLSELLLEDVISKDEITKLITDTTFLEYEFWFGNPPNLKYMRELSISSSHGHFESAARFVNKELKRIDELRPIDKVDEIEVQELEKIKSDERILDIISHNKETTEKLGNILDAYFMFHLQRKISHSLRQDILGQLVQIK